MSQTWKRSLLALLVLLTSAPLVRADDKEDIKTAGKAFGQAMRDGDIETARKNAVTDERSDKLLAAMSGLAKSKKKLIDSAVAKFGEEGKSIAPAQAGRTPEISKEFEDAQIEVNGDSAVVTPKTGEPVKFKKDGRWKLDFANLPHIEQMAMGLPYFEKIGSAMDDTSKEIGEGKYANLADAKDGFHKHLAAAMQGVGASGGRPKAPSDK